MQARQINPMQLLSSLKTGSLDREKSQQQSVFERYSNLRVSLNSQNSNRRGIDNWSSQQHHNDDECDFKLDLGFEPILYVDLIKKDAARQMGELVKNVKAKSAKQLRRMVDQSLCEVRQMRTQVNRQELELYSLEDQCDALLEEHIQLAKSGVLID